MADSIEFTPAQKTVMANELRNMTGVQISDFKRVMMAAERQTRRGTTALHVAVASILNMIIAEIRRRDIAEQTWMEENGFSIPTTTPAETLAAMDGTYAKMVTLMAEWEAQRDAHMASIAGKKRDE